VTFEVVKLVQSRQCGGVTRRSLLLALAHYAAHDGGSIFPANSTLAQLVGAHERTIQRNLNGLVRDGLLERAGRHSHRNGYTNEYRLCLSAIRRLPEIAQRAARSGLGEDATLGVAPPITPGDMPPVTPGAAPPVTPGAAPPTPRQSATQPYQGTLVPSPPALADWRTDPWMKRIFEVAGPGLVDPDVDKRVLVDLIARIPSWRMSGLSLEDDVVPVVAAKTEKERASGPYFTFKYIEPSIVAHHALRLQPARRVETSSMRWGQAAARTTAADRDQRPQKKVLDRQCPREGKSLAELKLDQEYFRQGRPFPEYRDAAPPPEGWPAWVDKQIFEAERRADQDTMAGPSGEQHSPIRPRASREHH
jgi:hypothetical protein